MTIANQMNHHAKLAKAKFVTLQTLRRELYDTTHQSFYEAEQIMLALNKTIGAKVIGAGFSNEGVYVFGDDDGPWGLLTMKYKTNNHGETKKHWHLYSPFIRKEKGESNVTKSTSHKGIINFIRKKVVQPISFDKFFFSVALAGGLVKSLDISNVKDFYLGASQAVVLPMYHYVSAIANGDNPPMPEEIERWVKECKPKVDRYSADNAKNIRAMEAFRDRSVVLTEVQYACDKPIHVCEMTIPAGGKPLMKDFGFVEKIEDLVDYPHIIGVSNLSKLEHPRDTLFDVLDDGYSKKYNAIKTVSTEQTFMRATILVFPAEFMDEVPVAKEEKAKVESDSIFSLDI